MNPKNNDGQWFKQIVLAPLHDKEIEHHPERINLCRSLQVTWGSVSNIQIKNR